MLRVLDLFSAAAGGWSLGMHRAGFETVAACEYEAWRRAVYSQNNPGVVLYDDVRTLTAARLLRDLGYLPDIIVGSPPCQDISSANTKGKGVDGERSGLFFEAIRIVGESRPRWVALENSSFVRTRGYDRIADALEEIGYSCEPFVVGADDIGAPHQRKRAWIIAFNAESVGSGGGRPWGCGAQGLPSAPVGEDASDASFVGPSAWTGPDIALSQPSGGLGADVAHADRQGLAVGQSIGQHTLAQCEALERAVGPAGALWNGGCRDHFRVAERLSSRVAGTRVPSLKAKGGTVNGHRALQEAYGDAVLPQIPEAIGRAILRVEAALACVSSIPQLQAAE